MMEAGNGVSAWIRRIAEIADVTSKISGGSLAVILLGLIVAAVFGWARIPMLDYSGQLAAYDEKVTESLQDRLETDKRLAATLEALQRELAKMNYVQQIRTCSEIINPQLREMCLR